MSIPDRDYLLEGAIKYLEAELMPTLTGEHRFKTRLAINALRIAQREADAEKRDRDQAPGTFVALDDRELSRQIREGEISLDDPSLRSYLRKSLERALQINNPKWLTR